MESDFLPMFGCVFTKLWMILLNGNPKTDYICVLTEGITFTQLKIIKCAVTCFHSYIVRRFLKILCLFWTQVYSITFFSMLKKQTCDFIGVLSQPPISDYAGENKGCPEISKSEFQETIHILTYIIKETLHVWLS